MLSREAIVEPAFSSIEEWLGHNTESYYQVLLATGQGRWNPGGDARLWVAYNLRAHHMQAQTVRRRMDEATAIWRELDAQVAEHALPDRVTDLLYEAVLGYRPRRSGYMKLAGIEQRSATRDLVRLVDVGLLDGRGQTRGRYYVAGPALVELRHRTRSTAPRVRDPYPELPAEVARRAAEVDLAGTDDVTG